jgi:YVTN family beta-propeller protein
MDHPNLRGRITSVKTLTTNPPAIEQASTATEIGPATSTGENSSAGILCSAVIRSWILVALFTVLTCVPARGTTFAYLTNKIANTVSVIDTASHAVVITVPVGLSPEGLAIRPDGAFAYVANSGSNTVSVINTINNRVVATIPVGTTPRTVSIRPDGAFAYVANFGFPTVSVINTATNSVVATVPVGGGQFIIRSLTLTPDGAFVYILANNPASVGSVFIVDTTTNTVVTTIPLGVSPSDLAITPNGVFVYVAGRSTPFEGAVYVISAQTRAVVNIINGIWDRFAITPDSAFVYVLSSGSGDGQSSGGLSVIDTTSNTIVKAIGLSGGTPSDIVMSSDGAFVLVIAPVIQVISTATNTVVSTLPLSANLRLTPDGAFAFVSAPPFTSLSIVNLASSAVLATVPSGLGADSLALTPDIPWGYQDISTMAAVSRSSFSQIIFPQLFVQFVSVRNNTTQPITGPITLTVNNLQNAVPVGNTLRSTMVAGADNVLSPGESVIFTLYFFKTLPGNITYTERVLSGTPPN